MKKQKWISLILILFLLSLKIYATEKVKFKYISLDVYGVKFLKPVGWKTDITAHYCKMTSPDVPNLELVYLEGNSFDGTLDQYLREYKKNLIDKKTEKIISVKPFEIAGYGAYYVRVRTPEKDLGHILFVKNNIACALALKTKKGEYSKYEYILKEVAKSFRTYNP